MLKTLQIKLNYKPTEWGVKIEGENIKAYKWIDGRVNE